MDSSICISLKNKSTNNIYEEIRIRSKFILPGYTITHKKDNVAWITDGLYIPSIAYISDLLRIIPYSSIHMNHSIIICIPGFPIMEFDLRDLDEKIISAIISRITDYLLHKWSVFNI